MAGVWRLVGATGKWTKQALLAFLEDLRPKLSDLDEREQYEILQQGGQMPALRAVLGGASPMAVLRDLSGGGTVIEHALKESSRLEVSDELLDEDSIRARLKVPFASGYPATGETSSRRLQRDDTAVEYIQEPHHARPASA